VAVVYKKESNLTKPKDPPTRSRKAPQQPAAARQQPAVRQQKRKTRCDCNTRLTLRIKPTTYQNLKVIGLKCDMSLNEVINRLLNLSINKRDLLESFLAANKPAGNAPRVIYFEGEV